MMVEIFGRDSRMHLRVDGGERVHRIIARNWPHCRRRGGGRRRADGGILAGMIIQSDDGWLRNGSLDSGAFKPRRRLFATCK